MPEAVEKKFYNEEFEAVLRDLNSGENGLSLGEAKKRAGSFGLNKLEEAKKFSALKLFLNQFKGLLVVVLIIAGIISLLTGDVLEAVAIFVILVINAALGFMQEFKAEKALEALKKMTALKATVVRGSKIHEIDAAEIVPGDIVMLQTGDKVPADLRLIEAVNLEIDEAVLTGESSPAKKFAEAIAGEKPIAERFNTAFSNTIVTHGRGKGIVTATGMKTEFGRIAGMIRELEEEETPLTRKLRLLSKTLVKIISAIIVVLFAVGTLYGNDPHEMFKVAVSLGVAAIPEGLPVVITITLGIGVLQMAKQNVLVRRMHSVEALGSTTVICSDKTGTLTRNEMVAEKLFVNNRVVEVTGKGYEPLGEFIAEGKKISAAGEAELKKLLEISAECNDSSLVIDGTSFKIVGDPTEGALAVMARKAGITRNLQRVNEIQFDSARKMMTTIHEVNGKRVAYSKGAVEVILSISGSVQENGKIKNLTAQRKKEILETSEKLAGDAYRILGFAFKELKKDENKEIESSMVFVGFAALKDPPRKEVPEAIRLAQRAGIKVKIITGDNPATTYAIAQRIGLAGNVVTGQELDRLNGTEFTKAVQENTVFARVSPEHKFRIVEALEESGEIVAVTGDGVNDAPALKRADIGIAMGIKGTDVTKGASDLILKDDNFSTIVIAVKEGRRVYKNIKDFVKYLLAANIGEVAVITIATLANRALPLLPLQILWLNIATDALPALALGTDESEKEVMEKKPRPTKEGVLDGTKTFIVIAGIIATIVTFAAFFYGLQSDELAGISLEELSSKEGFDFESKARTMAFTTLVVFELFLVFSCRGEGKGILELSPFSNKFLVKMVLVSFALQLLVVYGPNLATAINQEIDASTVNVLKTVPLNAVDWLVVLGLSSASALVPYIELSLKKALSK